MRGSTRVWKKREKALTTRALRRGGRETVTASRRRVSGRTAQVSDMIVVEEVEIAGDLFFVWWDVTNGAKCWQHVWLTKVAPAFSDLVP
jgi:hypothetical protein